MPGPSSSSAMSKQPLLSARSFLLLRHSACAEVGPSFYLAPLSKGLGGLEISGSIALPDRIHRFIPLVANDPRHYFALKQKRSRCEAPGRSRAPSYLKEDGMMVDTG